jgi:hypothetical protein
MNNHYRAPVSGKRSLAAAAIAPVVLAAGVYVALDRPSISVPAVVTPPDTAQRFTKNEPVYAPPPMPKAAPPAVAPPKQVVSRVLGPGVFKCEEANGAVTYSQYPCGHGQPVDTRPTSGGFADQWSISVKQR